MEQPLSYQQAGVDIAVADATKRAMADSVDRGDPRVLNRLGAFASLVVGSFPGYQNPVLVLKTEEPGTKQKLAFENGRVTSIAQDLIHHLLNDIAVMGAEPLYVQDCVLCGKLEPAVVKELVAALAAACAAQGCTLVGGETSEQPGLIEAGRYLLSAFVVGVVEKDKIVDGSRIVVGDVVLAVASNGLHTNGYSLARALLERQPDLATLPVEGQSLLDALLVPHRCYQQGIRQIRDLPGLHGMAHITGGGIAGNLNRVLPPTLDAHIDLSQLQIPAVFRALRTAGSLADDDMLRTFNMGAGLTLVCSSDTVATIQEELARLELPCYPIGEIVAGAGVVRFENQIG